jgi:hypothetical protein
MTPANGSAVRVGVVDGLDVTGLGTRLTVHLPTGGSTTWTAHVAPDSAAARRETAGIRRLLAVRVTARPDGVRCELFATSRRGPLRHPLSLPAALALTASGVHTVLAIC